MAKEVKLTNQNKMEGINKIMYTCFLFFFIGIVFQAQQSLQDQYLNSKPQKQEFNPKQWEKLKGTMLKEARGNANEKGEKFRSEDFQNNKTRANYYDYEEESYEGEFAKNSGEKPIEYFSEKKGQKNGFEKGEGANQQYLDSKERELAKGEYFSKNRDDIDSKKRNSSSSNSNWIGNLGPFMSIVLYVLLALFLGVIIYFLFVNTTLSDEGSKINELELEKAPVEISKSELELMLEKALKNNDYRLAIRIYFIFILKDFSEKEWIKWKKEKTNSFYLLEMRGRKEYETFNESVTIFELVWYGNYSISKEDYSQLEQKFKKFINDLAKV